MTGDPRRLPEGDDLTRAGVAHGHLGLERRVRQVRTHLEELEGPTAREDVTVLVVTLQEEMRAVHTEEEQHLFPYAAAELGRWHPILDQLVAEHRRTETQLARVLTALRESTPSADDATGAFTNLAAREFAAFAAVFDACTLTEASFFATCWDELFPGEVSPG